jgi:hypothetical protein
VSKPNLTLSCRVDVLDGGRRVEFTNEVGTVYLGGCKFQLALGNGGERPLTVDSMRIEFSSRDLEPLEYERLQYYYGKAIVPHQLFVELRRDGFGGWWMLSDGASLSGETRPISSAAPDIFDSEGAARLAFTLGPGETERIDGAILAREPGLYEVQLLARASDANLELAAKGSEPIRLCYSHPR